MRNNSRYALLHICSIPYFERQRKTGFMVSTRNSSLRPSTRATNHVSLQAVAPILQCCSLVDTCICQTLLQKTTST